MPAEDAEVLHHGTSPEHTAWLHSTRAPVCQCVSTRRLRAHNTVPPSLHTRVCMDTALSVRACLGAPGRCV